jgi:hypothetical protein
MPGLDGEEWSRHARGLAARDDPAGLATLLVDDSKVDRAALSVIADVTEGRDPWSPAGVEISFVLSKARVSKVRPKVLTIEFKRR